MVEVVVVVGVAMPWIWFAVFVRERVGGECGVGVRRRRAWLRGKGMGRRQAALLLVDGQDF